MKKNGTLIANLTRFVRQDSRFETNSKNITNNMNFTNQGLLTVETTITKLKEFGMSWLVSELRFRRVYQLPKKNLFDIYQTVPEFKQRTTPPTVLITGPNPLLSPASASTNTSKSKQTILLQMVVNQRKKPLEKLETNNEGTKSRSRSSSVSSITSNGSSSGLMRRGSISSPIKPSPLSLPQNGRNSPRTSRPNSMLFLSKFINIKFRK